MLLPRLPLSLFLCPYLCPDNKTQNTANTFFLLVTVLFLLYPNLLFLIKLPTSFHTQMVFLICLSGCCVNPKWTLIICDIWQTVISAIQPCLTLMVLFLYWKPFFQASHSYLFCPEIPHPMFSNFLGSILSPNLQNMDITCLHTLTTQKSPCTIVLLSYIYNSRHNVPCNLPQILWE